MTRSAEHERKYTAMSDVELLALLIKREDRGGSHDAQVGVGWSVRNRVDNPSWWGTDYRSVILKPWQYSSFNPGDPNENLWLQAGSATDEGFVRIAESVLQPTVMDPTMGATHYFDQSLDKQPPSWSYHMDKCMVIGRLRFYREREKVAA